LHEAIKQLKAKEGLGEMHPMQFLGPSSPIKPLGTHNLSEL